MMRLSTGLEDDEDEEDEVEAAGLSGVGVGSPDWGW